MRKIQFIFVFIRPSRIWLECEVSFRPPDRRGLVRGLHGIGGSFPQDDHPILPPDGFESN
jgi:hypothetical protein